MTEMLSLSDLRALARDCLTRAQAPIAVARAVAAEIAAAEAAGDRRNGMEALLRDIRLMRYGRLLADADPERVRSRAGVLHVNAAHGFAAAALAGAIPDLAAMAHGQGVALLRLDRASDPGAMISVTSALAERGLGALAFGALDLARVAHPDLVAPAALRAAPRSALGLLLPGLDLGQPADTPLGGPVSHVAWLVAVDLEVMGDVLATADPAQTETERPASGHIALPAELLEQIVTA